MEVKRYIPNKRSRFDLKLCEVSEYLWNCIFYLGKQKNVSAAKTDLVKDLGMSRAVIPQLMSELYNQGYHVYMDNWYTSEKLFTHLEANGTAACGTARRNRLNLPKTLRDCKLGKGEFSFMGDGKKLMIRYQDKKDVYFLSIIHEVKSANTGKRKRDGTDVVKLIIVKEYNKHMGGVKRNDAMLGNYPSVRKSLKWTSKVAFHFIKESLLNSFFLSDKVVGKKKRLWFKSKLIREMLDETAKVTTIT